MFLLWRSNIFKFKLFSSIMLSERGKERSKILPYQNGRIRRVEFFFFSYLNLNNFLFNVILNNIMTEKYNFMFSFYWNILFVLFSSLKFLPCCSTTLNIKHTLLIFYPTSMLLLHTHKIYSYTPPPCEGSFAREELMMYNYDFWVLSWCIILFIAMSTLKSNQINK